MRNLLKLFEKIKKSNLFYTVHINVLIRNSGFISGSWTLTWLIDKLQETKTGNNVRLPLSKTIMVPYRLTNF
jgi:hypothetical protein